MLRDIRNLFNHGNIRNIFRIIKKAMKDRIIKDITSLFEHKKEEHY